MKTRLPDTGCCLLQSTPAEFGRPFAAEIVNRARRVRFTGKKFGATRGGLGI